LFASMKVKVPVPTETAAAPPGTPSGGNGMASNAAVRSFVPS
jgi:hypothetical protein